MSLSEQAVRATVADALAQIEDDSPTYREPLWSLVESASALALLQREPALGRALFVELRKLRPISLWVRDAAGPALQQKRDACLDGAICHLGPAEQLPAPEGRECWLEVDAASAEITLRALPSGWGVIVTGELAQVSFAVLRKAAPLRALGAVLEDGHVAPLGARLDVAIVGAGMDPAQAGAARVLWETTTLDARQLPCAPTSPMPSTGVICEGKNALSWALALAAKRAAPSASSGPSR